MNQIITNINKNMKISIVTSKFPRPGGTFIQREINGFRKKGETVYVYPIYPRDKNAFVDPAVLSTLEGKPSYWENTRYVNVSSPVYCYGVIKFLIAFVIDSEIRSATKQYFNQGLRSLIKYLYSIPKAFAWSSFNETNSHVISFWGNYSGTVAYFLAKRFKLPFSTYLHAGTDLYRDRAFLLEKLLYAKHVITVCQFNVEFLKKTYPDHFNLFSHKIIVHHLGLDLKRYVSKPITTDRTPIKLCCIGGLSEAKGSFEVLKAFNKFVKSGNEGFLTYCGVGELYKTLDTYCQQNDLDDLVIFKGMCSSEEVNKTLDESHALIHGSPYIGDAVPTVIKEAMAMRRAVIGTNVAGIPELVEDGRSGLIVEPQKIEALTRAIMKLYSDRELCRQMGTEGRLIAEGKFNLWENTAQLLTKLNK